MPFAALDRPPLGICVLKAGLRAQDVASDVHCLSLAFSERLGREAYEKILALLPYPALVGEWVFKSALYGRDGAGRDYVQDVLRAYWKLPAADVDIIRHARGQVSGFLDDMMVRIPWGDYDVIGFSSFGAQNLASLALACRIRNEHPATCIVFGGSNWHDVMGEELLRRSPFVDAAFLGEADLAFPAFVDALRRGDQSRLGAVPGLATRSAGRVCVGPPAEPVQDLDVLPTPEFDDYFAAVADTGHDRLFVPALSLESSRGCWWAQRHPCLFCGLNGSARQFRTKSPEVVLEEMRSLTRRWRCSLVDLVDNVVSQDFLDKVLPALAADPLPVPFFLEVRPTVERRHVRLMRDAHASVQTGVESLSDEILRDMHKGTGVLENVRFLKWCRGYGVRSFWNIIYGFPGERGDDYDRMRELLPDIAFLGAPEQCGPLALERFSPYFATPSRHGFRNVRPALPYAYLYPFAREVVDNIAYFFDFDHADVRPQDGAVRAFRTAVEAWQADGPAGTLVAHRTSAGALVLLDSRGETLRETPLDPLDTMLYDACDDIASRDELCALAFAEQGAGTRDVDRRLTRFVDGRVMLARGDRYLSLALPGTHAGVS